MRFIHTSDLHLGKKLCGRSLIDDQRYILDEIVRISQDENADAVLVAGDVFDDGNNMTSESIKAFDDFMTSLSDKGIKLFVISGNHDSMERLGYGSRLFQSKGVYIAGEFDGDVQSVDLGDVVIHMIPFVKPAFIRRTYDCDAMSYDEAMSEILEHVDMVGGKKHILMTHQFVVNGAEGPERRESERSYVGGTESVNSSLFKDFDYVALGHIHSPQSIGRDNVRYCGTPLKYSLSERNDVKTVTVVDVGDDVTFREIELKPKRDLILMEGMLSDILEIGRTGKHRDDYVYIRLSDQNMNDMARLNEVFDKVMEVDYVSVDNGSVIVSGEPYEADIDLMEEFESFFRKKVGEDMNENQKRIVRELFEKCGVVF